MDQFLAHEPCTSSAQVAPDHSTAAAPVAKAVDTRLGLKSFICLFKLFGRYLIRPWFLQYIYITTDVA